MLLLDNIIIAKGPKGLAAAQRLATKGATVLVLEATAASRVGTTPAHLTRNFDPRIEDAMNARATS